MSSNTHRDRADQTNLSPSRASDGISADGTTIPAVDLHTNPCSDSADNTANHLVIVPPAQTSRRGFIMNSIVSAAAVASATAIPKIDHIPIANAASPAGVVARAEEVVDVLRTRYICQGWKIDEAAAERALAYCRGYAVDGSNPDDECEAAFDFFHTHGQPLDWIFRGNQGALISDLATHSPRERSLADAELLKLANEYVAAEQKYCDLNRRVDQWGYKPTPEVLKFNECDAELGLPSFKGNYQPAWDRPMDVNRLRAAEWLIYSTTPTEDEVTIQKMTPSIAARTRADEIVAAFDAWYKNRHQRGYKKAVREMIRQSGITD